MIESFKIPSATFPTLTGSIVTFNSQYAGLPLKSHKIALTATQSGSGTPSPDNVRTISGYSAINISHSDADTSNPTVYTIQIGSTVYGGEYDARSGVLTVTHGFVNVADMDILVSATGIFYFSIADALLEEGKLIAISNMLNYGGTQRNWLDDKTYAIAPWSNTTTNERFAIKGDGTETTVTDLKANMSGAYIVYELATPTTIQLPPCPIDTLEGVNNIWADTGDTTLQYPKFG